MIFIDKDEKDLFMIDNHVRRFIEPSLTYLATICMKLRIRPDWVTLIGFCLGILAIPMIALDHLDVALVLIILNRICDGIDGTLARMVGQSDRGGFLDIICDLIFYAGVPFGFALLNRDQNALAAAWVIFSFIGTGCSFLAYAIFAQKYGISTDFNEGDGAKNLPKAFYYVGGLTEGTETVIFLILICLFPGLFPLIAWIFGFLCFLTAGSRIYKGWYDFPAHNVFAKDIDNLNNDVDNEL